MSNLQGTGEEWRAMDGVGDLYKPGAEDALVAEARANIDRVRKRDVALRLVDRAGNPVADRTVELVQTRQAFEFGGNTWGLDTHFRYGDFDTDIGRYWKLRFKQLFNTANVQCYWTERPRNDGPKTEDLQGEAKYEGFAAIVDWAVANGMRAKGHPLFWSIPKCVPEWVKRYDYETQMKFVEVRVRSLVARFKGKVTSWDAINEAMWEPAFKHLAKRHWPHIDPITDIADYVEPVLRWARDEDPAACYVVNDYGMEQDKPGSHLELADGTRVTAASQRKRFLQLAEQLQQRGCPPDALGMQAHTGGWMKHATQLEIYDEMRTSGLPIHITEFWARTKPLLDAGMPEDEADAWQSRYVQDYLTVAFSHPALQSFHFWGFDGVKWLDKQSCHELKPIYHDLQKLLQEQWMTRQSVTTNADGVATFRGFFTDYQLRYDLGGGTQTAATFAVSPQPTMPLTVTLPLA